MAVRWKCWRNYVPTSSNSHIGTDTKEDKADAPLKEESIHPTEDAEAPTMEQEGRNNGYLPLR